MATPSKNDDQSPASPPSSRTPTTRPRRSSSVNGPNHVNDREGLEPLELSEPIVPEIWDPAWKRPSEPGYEEQQEVGEWTFLESWRNCNPVPTQTGDLQSSTGAVANNVIAPKFSISERKRNLALGALRTRPEDQILEEEDEGEEAGGVAENLAKANQNAALNELLSKTRIASHE